MFVDSAGIGSGEIFPIRICQRLLVELKRSLYSYHPEWQESVKFLLTVQYLEGATLLGI